jgi:CPA2 family monovalent cation:H+ antiporter-2
MSSSRPPPSAPLPIYARARDPEHARSLFAVGATQVISETVEASRQLAGRVLEGLGTPDEAVDVIVGRQREIEVAEFVAEAARRPKRPDTP